MEVTNVPANRATGKSFAEQVSVIWRLQNVPANRATGEHFRNKRHLEVTNVPANRDIGEIRVPQVGENVRRITKL